MTATCRTCDSIFRGVDRDEDGRADVPAVKCADPMCETYLCEATCQELSFQCGGCGLRFCNTHKIEVASDLDCCPTCAAECESAQDEPRRPIEMARPALATGAVA